MRFEFRGQLLPAAHQPLGGRTARLHFGRYALRLFGAHIHGEPLFALGDLRFQYRPPDIDADDNGN